VKSFLAAFDRIDNVHPFCEMSVDLFKPFFITLDIELDAPFPEEFKRLPEQLEVSDGISDVSELCLDVEKGHFSHQEVGMIGRGGVFQLI